MTTISATPNNTTGSVDLVITKTAGVTSIVRTNVNGSEEVRASSGQLPSPYVTTEVARNHALNPSGETDTTGYATSAGTGAVTTLASVASASSITGTKVVRTTWTTGGSSSGGTYYRAMTGSAGDVISVGVWVRYSVAGNANMTVAVRNVSTEIAAVTTPTKSVQANTWEFFSVEGLAAPGTYTYVQVWPRMTAGMPTGSTQDLDGIIYSKTETLPPYFDGSTPADETGTYAWTGAAHASASIKRTGGTVVLTDYEASHGANSYNVYASDGSFVTTSTTLGLDKPWLSVPVMPQYSEQVEAITSYGAGREANTTVHKPLGRADSLVVMGKLGDRTGSLEVFCPTYAAARKLERVFERGEVVQLRQKVEGLDMYFTATSIPVSPYSVEGEDGTRWAMTINYVEVRRPIGDLAGAIGWNYNELAASFDSYNTVTEAFVNYDSLTLGDANV